MKMRFKVMNCWVFGNVLCKLFAYLQRQLPLSLCCLALYKQVTFKRDSSYSLYWGIKKRKRKKRGRKR